LKKKRAEKQKKDLPTREKGLKDYTNGYAFDPDFLYQSLNQVKELNSKKRTLRSFRGFLLYGLEIINQGKFSKVLQTNLNSYFWLKLPSVIRQNRKEVLLQFLFPPTVPNNGEDRPSNI
jgi:hypothetical protein